MSKTGYKRTAVEDLDSTAHLQTNELLGDIRASDEEVKYFPVKCGFFESLFFTWYTPMIHIGAQRKLDKKDMFALPSCLQSKEIYATFIQCWTLESLKQATRNAGSESTLLNPPQPKLLKVLHSMIFYDFWYAGICRLATDTLVIVGALLIKNIVLAAECKNFWLTFELAFAILVCSVFQAITLQQFIHGSFLCGSRVVAASTAAIFHSSLSFRLHQMDPPKSIGEINNVQAKDSSSLREFVVFFHNLWACPLMIVACVGLLLYLLGYAGLVSCVLLPLLLPLESYVSKRARAARKQVLVYSDKRMALVGEIIDGILTVKLTDLCPLICAKVLELRDAELAVAWKGMLIEMINMIITRSSALVITLVTFLVYTMISSVPLTADRAFAALAVINILNRPLVVLPKCVSMLSEAMVSSGRIEALIHEGRKHNSRLLELSSFSVSAPPSTSSSADGSVVPVLAATLAAKPGVIIKFLSSKSVNSEVMELACLSSVSGSSSSLMHGFNSAINVQQATALRQPNDVVVLRDVQCCTARPGLVVVIGNNASGKTSLLLTMLNELKMLPGGLALIKSPGSSVGYCGHESWIVNQSAKANIMMAAGAGRPVPRGRFVGGSSNIQALALAASTTPSKFVVEDDEEEDDGRRSCPLELPEERTQRIYRSAIEACALDQDFDVWLQGEDTIIGEKGVNISGGQKQRISLARALCSEAQVLLLDSVLSGLDVMVTNHVFREAIQAAAKSRLVVLATCQRQWLPFAQQIIVMHEGRVAFDGTYQQLQECRDCVWGDLTSAEDTSTSSTATLPKTSAVVAVVKNDKKNKKYSAGASSGKGDDIVKESASLRVYLEYAKACGLCNLMLAVTLTVLAFGGGAFADFQMAAWTDGRYSTRQYFTMYTIASVCIIVLNFGRYFMYSYSGMHASRILHCRLLQSILGATFGFFNTTPSGRITSRFSVDFDTIDFSIPQALSSLSDSVLGIITGVGVVVISSPLYILVIFPLTWKYLHVQGQYRHVSKELKKIDSGAKSPLFSHFRETLAGLETIHGYGIEDKLIQQHHELLDNSIRARINWDAANRWLGIRLDCIGSLIVSAAAFAVLFSMNGSGGKTGLMLSYALKATQSLSFAIRASTALENMFTSPERVFDYIDTEQEVEAGDAPLHNAPTAAMKALVQAPSSSVAITERLPSGQIEMKGKSAVSGVSTVLAGQGILVRYSPELPLALNNLSFTLQAGKLIAICGRTGCGKSTLSLLLARGLPNYQGQLQIFSQQVKQLPLAAYRSAIRVFPQDSYIFSGRLRDFLDPLHIYDDVKLNGILSDLSKAMQTQTEQTSNINGNGSSTLTISAAAPALSLDMMNASAGSTLSAGQRQIVVLARAALSQAAVVILDEITSNMDSTAIRSAIGIVKQELTSRGVAVVMIAHGLDEVAMCDEVWVMAAGKIVECGAPMALAAVENGLFAAMWAAKQLE